MSDPEECPARWSADRSLVMYRLDDLDGNITRIREEQIQTRIFVGIHRANAAVWGAVAGAITAALVSIVTALVAAYFTKGG